MTRIRVGEANRVVSGARSALALPLLGAFLLAVAPSAHGNPYPGKILLTHVQPVGGSLCDGLPISSCEQITQWTSEMGVLEFDPMLDWALGDPPPECTDLWISFEWPAAWRFVGAEVCGAPQGDLELTGNRGVIHWSTTRDLPMGESVMGLARLMLDVTTPGSFLVLGFAGCEEGTYYQPYGARAGPACGDCFEVAPCSHDPLRVPRADLESLELRAPVDSTAVGRFSAHSTQADGRGTLSFTASDPWISLHAELTFPPHSAQTYRITVSAGGDHRDPGVYEGWVEMRSADCYACVPVVLTVSENTPAAAESWGSLKNRFRAAESTTPSP
jgi:hypothetical protein